MVKIISRKSGYQLYALLFWLSLGKLTRTTPIKIMPEANACCFVIASPTINQPSKTATTGFTYA